MMSGTVSTRTRLRARRLAKAGGALAGALVLLLGITAFVAATPAGATDTASEAALVNAVNSVRTSKGRAPLGVHPVLVAKARNWAARMAAARSLSHSRLSDGITVSWTKLAENVGSAGDATAVHRALVASPAHYANIVDPAFRWVGIGAVRGADGILYVAQEFMAGAAPAAGTVQAASPAPAPPPPPPPPAGRSVASNPKGGYYVLAGDGLVTAHGGAPGFGSPRWPHKDLARDMAVMPDGQGYVVLDAWGGVHRFGSARGLPGGSPYWRGWDIARRIEIAPGGRGFAVLDGWGGVHGVGVTVPRGLPYWRGWDIARGLAFTPSGGVYVLDGWGGVHRAGGAPYLGGPYWRGWDIARDIAVAPSGRGYAVLDGFGGIHVRGSASLEAASGGYVRIDAWNGLAASSGGYLAVRADGKVITP